MKNKLSMTYSIIRFQPFVETGEFANVGIVMIAPETGYFDFRLETKRTTRITDFFEGLAPTTLKATLSSVQSELTRIRSLSGYMPNGQQKFEFWKEQNAIHLFMSLTKNREGNVRFGDHRYAFHSNPDTKLKELFDHYVRHDFVTPLYQEAVLEKSIRGFLKNKLENLNYRKEVFTDGLYSASFPFVFRTEDGISKILKPLYLGQSDPNRILEHGNKWLYTIRRLQEKLPNKILFAVQGPNSDGKREKAFEEAVADLEKGDIRVVRATDSNKIVEFASH
jgi:Protein of unknown function (DUF3037)